MQQCDRLIQPYRNENDPMCALTHGDFGKSFQNATGDIGDSFENGVKNVKACRRFLSATPRSGPFRGRCGVAVHLGQPPPLRPFGKTNQMYFLLTTFPKLFRRHESQKLRLWLARPPPLTAPRPEPHLTGLTEPTDATGLAGPTYASTGHVARAHTHIHTHTPACRPELITPSVGSCAGHPPPPGGLNPSAAGRGRPGAQTAPPR